MSDEHVGTVSTNIDDGGDILATLDAEGYTLTLDAVLNNGEAVFVITDDDV